MNLEHDFFQVSKLSKDQKVEHFFSPSSGEQSAHQSQIIGGDADEDHTQIIGGIYPPRVSAPLPVTILILVYSC